MTGLVRGHSAHGKSHRRFGCSSSKNGLLKCFVINVVQIEHRCRERERESKDWAAPLQLARLWTPCWCKLRSVGLQLCEKRAGKGLAFGVGQVRTRRYACSGKLSRYQNESKAFRFFSPPCPIKTMKLPPDNPRHCLQLFRPKHLLILLNMAPGYYA